MAVLVEGLTTEHETKLGAHEISGVSGLQDALNGKEVAGAATSAVNGHAAKSGAHPISGVSGLQSSLDLKFSPTNKPAIGDVAGLQSSLDSKSAINILINGEVTRVNQRGFDGNWSAIAVGAYGYDRWKKADSTNMTQIIEAGEFIPSEKYHLSGAGVSDAVLTAPSSGNWAVTVPQAARNVQLVIGDRKLQRSVRPMQQELAMCQRYYWRMESSFAFYKKLSWNSASLFHPVSMRSTPSASAIGGGNAIGDTSGALLKTNPQCCFYAFSNGNEGVVEARYEFSSEL